MTKHLNDSSEMFFISDEGNKWHARKTYVSADVKVSWRILFNANTRS